MFDYSKIQIELPTEQEEEIAWKKVQPFGKKYPKATPDTIQQEFGYPRALCARLYERIAMEYGGAYNNKHTRRGLENFRKVRKMWEKKPGRQC